jgi:hypothetical protein
MPTKDPTKIKLKRQRYYQKHKEVLLQRSKEWIKKHPNYKKEYRKKNGDKIRAKERLYQKTHPELRREIRRRIYFNGVRSFSKKPYYMFNSICLRLRRPDKWPTYIGKKILFSKQEFVVWVLVHESYPRLFKAWEESGYRITLCPTIDRIDNNGHYSFDNIQLITQLENSRKRDLMV